MPRSPAQLRRDALAIWQAGLEAVRSERLMHDSVRVEGGTLWLGDEALDLARIERIVVVGAGKAGAGMAAGLEEALGPKLMQEKQLSGQVNVPADCLRRLSRITLHAARPAGMNEPTEEGERGSQEILRQVESLGKDDLCLCLLSGGASALLPAPIAGITLADKQAVTRFLSGAGANIQELNTVRKQLSRIKGGGLARACRAGTLRTLIISDVLGDPLDVIGSGPTVPDPATATDALAVLSRFAAHESDVPAAVWQTLRWKAQQAGSPSAGDHAGSELRSTPGTPADSCDTALKPAAEATPAGGFAPHAHPTHSPPSIRNLVIGNNAVAVDAAGLEAERLGYSAALDCATKLEGEAEQIGRHLAEMAAEMRARRGPDCLISGGEPVVKLAPAAERGRGGRNQQLVLAALEHLPADGAAGMVILSGGTDGEDGPTDAAGAWFDAEIIAAARRQGLDPASFLRRNDAYRFFAPLEALLMTGPTHTNVCDLRVVVVDRIEAADR